MKINGPNRTDPVGTQTSSTKLAEVRPIRSQDKETRVDISDTAQLFNEAKASEVLDPARIEALREGILNGSIAVDYDKIAEKIMIEDME